MSRRAVGGTIGIAGLVFIGLGTTGVGTIRNTSVSFTDTDPDTGCTVTAVCLNESHEATTATGFSDHDCDNITGRDTSLDYFVFVLPAFGDPGRTFTTPAPTVTFDTGVTSGTIGSNAKFFFASAAPGSILEEATANANNGSGTPKHDFFNLTHTCPAAVSSTTTTSTTTTTSKSTKTTTETTTTTTPTSTTTAKTTTTTTTTPTTTTTSQTTMTIITSTTPTTTTTTTTTTPTTTTTTTTTPTSGTSATSSSSETSSSESSSSESSSSESSTSPTTSTTTSTTGTGSVSGTSTTSSTPTTTTTGSLTITTTTSGGGGGGVLGVTTPSTGADTEFGAGLALLILGGAITFGGARLSRRKRQ